MFPGNTERGGRVKDGFLEEGTPDLSPVGQMEVQQT